ncbi:hypothetical protein Tco_1044786 [Tanacetum coccineum]|uniref:Reverse transcriptase Ty1/copia-type domain-containing protein n=1 Tax=Tanacetum coccineum TaxID=301880 RepID=A0ABQ5GQX1_9ASTR
MGYSFYYPPENKVLVARNAEFLKNSLITQKASGYQKSEIIQEEDRGGHSFYNTSLNHEEDDLEMDEPQSDIIPIRRSTRTRRPTDREAAYILGIKIYRDRSRRLIGLCQSAYIEKILKRFHMENSKLGSDLKRVAQGFSCYTDAGISDGLLMTLSLYLKCFVLNGGAVTGRGKQSIFVYFNCRSWVSSCLLMLLRSRNANESGITKGARHFRAKVHYLREVIEFGDIKLEKVHTDDNLADPFTKALAFPKHSELTRNIGMLPASSFM